MLYDLREEPAEDAYRELLLSAQRQCPSGLVVVRESLELGAEATAALADLQPFIRSAERRGAWPGTELFGVTALVHEFRLTDDVIHILGHRADRLYAWVQPALPEDLCMLRPDGQPWLVSVSHEREAYLVLSASEREELSHEAPTLARLLSAGRDLQA